MSGSLYESLSAAPPVLEAIGRTEGTKSQETIDRDRDSTELDSLGTGFARDAPSTRSLYRALSEAAVEKGASGETLKTAAKETLDNDAEAAAFEFDLGANVSSPYRWLSVPAPSATDPSRTESTRDARETLDNDRESESLVPLSSLG